jgi:hypothetical protein
MTDQTTPARFNSFTLDSAITINGDIVHQAGTEIMVRKPGAGELRGLAIASLLQMDYNSLEAIAPRVTTPILHKHHVAAMDPADLTQLGSEVTDFLLPKGAKASSPQA